MSEPFVDGSAGNYQGDGGSMEQLEARAEALYLRIMNMNMTFQENTAGEKVAKDQSGKVQG